MSDETTLLPCPFCGGEASWIAAQQREDGTYYPAACGCRKCGIWRYGESDYGHGGFATEQDRKVSMEQAISKWNTRATHGTLTAEQVRKAISIGGIWDEDSAMYYVNRTDMQAIADELNAELGSGTCEMVLMWSDYEDGECYKCSKCCDFAFTLGGEPRFCPNCGAKVIGG